MNNNDDSSPESPRVIQQLQHLESLDLVEIKAIQDTTIPDHASPPTAAPEDRDSSAAPSDETSVEPQSKDPTPDTADNKHFEDEEETKQNMSSSCDWMARWLLRDEHHVPGSNVERELSQMDEHKAHYDLVSVKDRVITKLDSAVDKAQRLALCTRIEALDQMSFARQLVWSKENYLPFLDWHAHLRDAPCSDDEVNNVYDDFFLRAEVLDRDQNGQSRSKRALDTILDTIKAIKHLKARLYEERNLTKQLEKKIEKQRAKIWKLDIGFRLRTIQHFNMKKGWRKEVEGTIQLHRKNRHLKRVHGESLNSLQHSYWQKLLEAEDECEQQKARIEELEVENSLLTSRLATEGTKTEQKHRESIRALHNKFWLKLLDAEDEYEKICDVVNEQRRTIEHLVASKCELLVRCDQQMQELRKAVQILGQHKSM